MKARLRFFAPFIMIFAISIMPQVAKAIEVSGDVSGTWIPDNNPYLVVGDLAVPQGLSLSILPGCHIEFRGYYQFVIDSLATLTALGLETDSIIFTARDNNDSGWNGLRFYQADSSCELAYCRFEWGRGAGRDQFPDISRSNGGAIYLRDGFLSVRNSLFHFNRASEGYGGAIYTNASNISVSKCILEYNRSGFGGAAIFATSSSVHIENNSISKDSTYYPLGGEIGGGAIGCVYSITEIKCNLISNNFCGMSGGGILINANIPLNSFNSIIYDNIITNNQCYSYGAGAYIGGISVVSNNIICQNQVLLHFSSAGGGIACRDSVLLNNNTISDNYCPNAGGGIYRWASALCDTFKNNIIRGNIAETDSQINCVGSQPVFIYNNVQGGWAGEGNIDSDPLFADTAGGDFRLTWANYPAEDSTKSPCIDSGDPSSPPDSDNSRADMGALFFDRRLHDPISEPATLPESFFLFQNYPNPFNSQTTIGYTMPRAGEVDLSIYNIIGQKIITIFDSPKTAGRHEINWDASDCSSGLYYAKLKTLNHEKTIKLILLK
jgi:hypothetical protein